MQRIAFVGSAPFIVTLNHLQCCAFEDGFSFNWFHPIPSPAMRFWFSFIISAFPKNNSTPLIAMGMRSRMAWLKKCGCNLRAGRSRFTGFVNGGESGSSGKSISNNLRLNYTHLKNTEKPNGSSCGRTGITRDLDTRAGQNREIIIIRGC